VPCAFGAGADVARDKVQLCASCHGEGGNSRTRGMPSLAGQPKTFIETQLILFREGVRDSREMQAIAKSLSDAEISALGAFFAAVPVEPDRSKGDPELLARGRAAARKLMCGSCHQPDFHGRDQVPRIAAQREDYLVDAMIAFRDNKRIGGDTIMAAVLYGVPDADIRAMAHLLARTP
jgi:cytochrome c553